MVSLATDFSFTHIGSEKEKVKNCYRKCNSKESMVLQERDDWDGGGDQKQRKLIYAGFFLYYFSKTMISNKSSKNMSS